MREINDNWCVIFNGMFKDGFSNDEITPRYVNLEISTFVGFCVEGFLKSIEHNVPILDMREIVYLQWTLKIILHPNPKLNVISFY